MQYPIVLFKRNSIREVRCGKALFNHPGPFLNTIGYRIPAQNASDRGAAVLCDIWLWQSLRLIWRRLNFITLFHIVATDPVMSLHLLRSVRGWFLLILVAKEPQEELGPVL